MRRRLYKPLPIVELALPGVDPGDAGRWSVAPGESRNRLELNRLIVELMRELDHLQTVGARADEFRRKAHHRPDVDDSVHELECRSAGVQLLPYTAPGVIKSAT